MTIKEKLSKIQVEFKAKKSRYNSFGKYNFRSAEDILEALKPFNEKYKVHTIIDESVREVNGQIIMESTAIMHDCESVEQIMATSIVGVDLNQRGMNVPQQFGSASSYAKKYALGNLLLIDDTQDADATNKHGKDKTKLLKGSDKWFKALEYIKNGGDIEVIKSKYIISAENEKELKDA
jgi:hypothetical protein